MVQSRNTHLFALLLICVTWVNVDGQIGRLPLSPSQKIEQNIGITDIIVEYSRPSKRGREIFGELVPYGKYWRTGANRNTTISFNQDVVIGDQRVEKGKYAIFTIPNPKEWEVIFYKNIDNWDVPSYVDSSQIAATITVPAQKSKAIKEVLEISIGDFDNYIFDLNIAWDDIMVSIPIKLVTKELMEEKIKRNLNGPIYEDYYLAAVYQMESGKEYGKGLEWINKAMEMTDEVGWWDYRVKAILLLELGRRSEARAVANKGLAHAIEVKRESMITEFNRILKELKSKE